MPGWVPPPSHSPQYSEAGASAILGSTPSGSPTSDISFSPGTFQAKVNALQHLQEIQHQVQLEQAIEASLEEVGPALQSAPPSPARMFQPLQLPGTVVESTRSSPTFPFTQ
eukprot:10856385-Prorocentrum_lima.AAC.1